MINKISQLLCRKINQLIILFIINKTFLLRDELHFLTVRGRRPFGRPGYYDLGDEVHFAFILGVWMMVCGHTGNEDAGNE
ncbi:MAG: hypothetical protein D3925_12210 [Candidatus Electrothrix sp. AR5]|nr:hypothetical protein [Candidatus Electrothrix sp. AR5]